MITLHFFSSSYNFLFLSTAVHETSKRLSQTLRDIYEPDWNGMEDLAVIIEVCSWCVVCLNRYLRVGPPKPDQLIKSSSLWLVRLIVRKFGKLDPSYYGTFCFQSRVVHILLSLCTYKVKTVLISCVLATWGWNSTTNGTSQASLTYNGLIKLIWLTC